MPDDERWLEVADLLRAAERMREPCDPVAPMLPGATVADAYQVQRINTVRELASGRRRSGWKIGLTSPAVQQQLGVDQPDFGTLFDDTRVDVGPIDLGQLIAPKIEVEVAFSLSRDLSAADVSASDVVTATEYVVPAIEIVDSRIRDWEISIVDTVCDNASSGRHILGKRATRLADVDLPSVRMELLLEGQLLSQGTGAACMGNPINAVVWLANTLVGLGTPLLAGDVVLSGALGPMVTVTEPSLFEAHIEGLGDVQARFVDET
jgi:2-keto-4-pentenoate hydratase